jgi:uncharacterized membrane protein YciS (DUF1049 family)
VNWETQDTMVVILIAVGFVAGMLVSAVWFKKNLHGK